MFVYSRNEDMGNHLEIKRFLYSRFNAFKHINLLLYFDFYVLFLQVRTAQFSTATIKS